VGLLIFLAVFIGATLWAFRKSGKSHYQYMESLPLSEEGAVKKGAIYEQ
jgi:cbb3-type cytochrome oxidase subunit 3